MWSATTDSRNALNYAHRNNHSLQNTEEEPKRPQPQPPHTRGTFHRRLQPLYTVKHNVSCSGFLHTTQSVQHSCSHSNAICNHRFKKRMELRTQEQPLVAEHRGGTKTTAAATAAHTRYISSPAEAPPSSPQHRAQNFPGLLRNWPCMRQSLPDLLRNLLQNLLRNLVKPHPASWPQCTPELLWGDDAISLYCRGKILVPRTNIRPPTPQCRTAALWGCAKRRLSLQQLCRRQWCSIACPARCNGHGSHKHGADAVTGDTRNDNHFWWIDFTNLAKGAVGTPCQAYTWANFSSSMFQPFCGSRVRHNCR